jgi:hypothetical protein
LRGKSKTGSGSCKRIHPSNYACASINNTKDGKKRSLVDSAEAKAKTEDDSETDEDDKDDDLPGDTKRVKPHYPDVSYHIHSFIRSD